MGQEGREKRGLSRQEQVAQRAERQQNLRNIEGFERERRSIGNIGREAQGQYTGAMSDFGRETTRTKAGNVTGKISITTTRGQRARISLNATDASQYHAGIPCK
jgi:hypothetical protein